MARSRVLIIDASSSLFQTAESSTDESSLVLQSIPDFRSIVAEICKDISGTEARRKAVSMDIGMICHSSAVRTIGRALHDRVQKCLKEQGIKKEVLN